MTTAICVDGYTWGLHLNTARRANVDMRNLLAANAEPIARLPGMATVMFRLSLLLQTQNDALGELETIHRRVRHARNAHAA